MLSRILLFLLTVLVCNTAFGQYFEGEANFINYFLDKETLKQLVEPQSEIVTIKGGKCKIVLPNAERGGLEWEIDNFYEGLSFSRKSYKNIDYVVTDKEPTFSKDGKLIFPKPDSVLIAPIFKRVLCNQLNDTLDVLTKYDTTFLINGLKCNLIINTRNNKKTDEYYYCDSIKIDPIQYKCNRVDRLDKFYKLTGGSLIVQLVTYSDLYTLVYQLQSITPKRIEDSFFDIPKGISIQDIK